MGKTEVEEPPRGSPWDNPLVDAPLVFLDLEMTGLRPAVDRVIEVCAERVRGDKLEASLTTLVRPEDGAYGNAHVHGIEREALASAPTFAQIAKDLLDVIGDGILVAHAAEWDVTFLEAELARTGKPQRFPFFLDTLVMSRRAFVLPSHGLEALSASLGIARQRAHRAGDDVLAMREVFRHVVTALTPDTPRDLWHVRIGQRHARPAVVEAAQAAVDLGKPVKLRYRPAHRGPEDLFFCITSVRTDLDPPRVLGYLHPSRSRRELRADRILQIELIVPSGDEPRK
jgi:DNA polymerase-3 subunit epsilon